MKRSMMLFLGVSLLALVPFSHLALARRPEGRPPAKVAICHISDVAARAVLDDDGEPVLDDDGNQIYDDKEISIVDGRVFRTNFYDAFIQRMTGRLWEIRRSAEREAGVLVTSSETALAVRNKKEEVDKTFAAYRATVRRIGEYKGAESSSSYSSHGRAAGTKAAETVPVGNTGRSVKH